MSEQPPTILIADDEPGLADGHAARLSEYDVRTAYGGTEALESLTSEIDIVLLDRRMPGASGDEVLEHIRDRGLDCQVAMLTGVDPDVDIVSMGFDEYLKKPISREELQDAIDRMSRRSTYDSKLQEYFSLASKRAALETEYAEAELDEKREFDRLCSRIEETRQELDAVLEALPERDGYLVAADRSGSQANVGQ